MIIPVGGEACCCLSSGSDGWQPISFQKGAPGTRTGANRSTGSAVVVAHSRNATPWNMTVAPGDAERGDPARKTALPIESTSPTSATVWSRIAIALIQWSGRTQRCLFQAPRIPSMRRTARVTPSSAPTFWAMPLARSCIR